MNRRDPRIRQTLDRINSTLESANLTTQASLFSFSQSYITPCLSSLTTCLESSCYPCFGARRDAERRRNRNRMGRTTQRGRPELVFDFYNDEWDDLEDGEGAGLLGGWGNDELDRLLAGSGGGRGRQRRMSYGSKGLVRKGLVVPGKAGETDPMIVPNSSMFGFLERLPWKLGGRGVKYRPSAADLQDNPGRKSREEGDALLEESESEGNMQRQRRKRSDTNASRSTNNSLSSRGDLFPSEDEDDAVPLDDEFAMALERRTTRTESEAGSGKPKGKRPSVSKSQSSTKTGSSKDTKSTDYITRGTSEVDLPSMDDLRLEEERVRLEEEADVERKRRSARQLARERGLSIESPQATAQSAEEEFRPPDEAALLPQSKESPRAAIPIPIPDSRREGLEQNSTETSSSPMSSNEPRPTEDPGPGEGQ